LLSPGDHGTRAAQNRTTRMFRQSVLGKFLNPRTSRVVPARPGSSPTSSPPSGLEPFPGVRAGCDGEQRRGRASGVGFDWRLWPVTNQVITALGCFGDCSIADLSENSSVRPRRLNCTLATALIISNFTRSASPSSIGARCLSCQCGWRAVAVPRSVGH